MATMEKEFEFPDEQEVTIKDDGVKVEFEIEGDDPIDIEVVDDTPEKDRNRKPMTEPPEEVTEEELSRYKDTRLRDRLAHLNKGYHEERRAKEAAIREREEALVIAQRILAENQELRGSVQNSQKSLLEQAKATVTAELEKAKRDYKNAYEAGDSDALLAAQEELTGAKLKLERINSYRPPPSQPQRNPVQTEQVPQSPAREAPRDDRALAWKEKNQWFNQDREMTGFALAVHEKLVEEEGVDPRSDEYYRRVDARMREVFPDKFSDTKSVEKPKRSNVVAPATRSTAPRKVVLTPSAVSIAKRLGIPLELYAKKVAEEMRKDNG